jgi:hypothetical protein
MVTTGFTKFAAASIAAAAIGLGALATAATADEAPSAVTVAVPPAAQHTTVGQPFLPAYLEMLQGRRPFPQDTCAQPRNLQELLIPCD